VKIKKYILLVFCAVVPAFIFFIWSPSLLKAKSLLSLHQNLKTSGAREITPFQINKERYLAVPQLAYDIMSLPANMNGGKAEADILIYKMSKGKFELHQSLPGFGNEGAEFFQIGNDSYLATCSVDAGPKPPFNLNTYQKVFKWSPEGKVFYPIQHFPAYGSKAWTHFKLGDHDYLALANGVVLPHIKGKNDTSSTLFRWDGKKFQKFQSFDTKWGYKFTQFNIGQKQFLGLTDHLQKSVIYEWKGSSFEKFQEFDETGGRVFYHFKIAEKNYLALANINHQSKIYLWENNKFTLTQTLEGLGGRNFLHFQQKGQDYLLKVIFITGPRTAPEPVQKSPIYLHKDGKFIKVDAIDTSGGVSASLYKHEGSQYIAVANSLTKDIRYRVDSKIYKVNE